MFSSRPKLAGTLVGLLVTGASTFIMFGFENPWKLELQAFDMRMRNCNDLAAASPIVHVDIDDGALDRVGRWPWHRDRTADLIRALKELGAKHIMVDLLFSEPEADYYDEPADRDEIGSVPSTGVVGERSEANHVFPDLELADAVRTAGNVILSVQLETIAPDAPGPLFQRLMAIREKRPAVTTDDALTALSLPDTSAERSRVGRELFRLRMRDALLTDFTLSDAALAERLGATPAQVSAVVAGVKRWSAVESVSRELAARPSLTRDELMTAILKNKRHRLNADTGDVLAAIDTMRGLIALNHSLRRADSAALPNFSRASAVVPPYHRLAEAANDIAAVSFASDSDGIVRRIPILIGHEGRFVLHMGFAAAARVMGLEVDAATLADARTLVVPFKSGGAPLRLPLDGRGNLLIHWTRSASRWQSGADFDHISAAKVWSMVDARREMRQNDRMAGYLMAEVVAAAKGVIHRAGTIESSRSIIEPADRAYRERVNRHLELEQKIHFAILTERGDAPETDALRAESARLQSDIDREHEAAVSDVTVNCMDLSAYSAKEIDEDPELKAAAERFLPAKKLLDEDIPALKRANETLATTLQSVRDELAPRIRDRSVFVGYAATASGDIVSTPIAPQTNGVMCHAQVLNSILQNRFIRVPPPWIAIVMCLALGAFTGFVTATRGPGSALVVTLALLAFYGMVNALVFFKWRDVWLAAAPGLVTIFFVWAFVTLFRQLTAERDKRLFRKQLSQYTSPAIAAKIAESPDAARAFKAVQTRNMTCLFSDLKGFTTITEQEDAAVVQHVLNVYLERMSEVIWSHRGLINKFMGDGIMAIFNPSVDPLDDHPGAACRAALAVIEELERLKRDRVAGGDSPVFSKLEMRLGLAAGPCMNGDLGSELKADYTVIGDVVNLAARLEPANKVFGTSILVSGPLYEAVRSEFEFRYLAELQVKGKARTVPVYEMLGRRGEVAEEALAYARRFEAGVEMYKLRKWDESLVHFTRMLARRPDDAGASRYVDACQELKTFPPSDDWAGALELKEK